jgi:hypothetical protein
MSYTRFNRHESMKSETLSEIMDIKRELYREDVKREPGIRSLENMLFGLFDGYLYENLILEAQKLPLDLFKRVQNIYFTCMDYPHSETQTY